VQPISVGILTSGVEQISEPETGLKMIGTAREGVPEMFDGLRIFAEGLQQHRMGVEDPGMVRIERKSLLVAGCRGVEIAGAGMDRAQAPMRDGGVLVDCDRLHEISFRVVKPVGHGAYRAQPQQ